MNYLWSSFLCQLYTRRVHSVRLSESYTRRDCASATLYTFAISFWFWCVTRGDSQARHETLWLGHHGPLKKQELMRRDTSARGYTRASECFHLHSCSRTVSGSLNESVHPALELTNQSVRHYWAARGINQSVFATFEPQYPFMNH